MERELTLAEAVLKHLPAESLPILLIVVLFGYFFIKFQKETSTHHLDFVSKDELQLHLLKLENKIMDSIRNG